MPDDKGHLILYNRSLEKIDEVFYDADMHYSLLGGYEGISLEKVTDKWEFGRQITVAFCVGVGRVGQRRELQIRYYPKIRTDGDKVVLSSTKITPDNDGNEDVLVIHFTLEGLGKCHFSKCFR